ncbi:pilin [Patescibacteria group bacterium]|nr:pilin [Patescibacteria group bacterium]
MRNIYYKFIALAPIIYLGIRSVSAQECPDGVLCVPPILRATSTDALISSAVTFLTALAGSILVIVVLVGAFIIMTSAGNPEKIKKGRQAITWGLIGFAVILVAGGLGSIVAGILGGTVDDVGGPNSSVNTPEGVIGVVDNIAYWMFNILMALGTVFVLFAAFLYMISRGDPEKIQTAKRALIYAIVALVIGVLSGGVDALVKDALKTRTPTQEHNRCVKLCVVNGPFLECDEAGVVDITECCETIVCSL